MYLLTVGQHGKYCQGTPLLPPKQCGCVGKGPFADQFGDFSELL